MIKHLQTKMLLLLGLLLAGVGTAWAKDVTSSIVFGTNDVKINAASVTGDDSQGNTWTITTEGTTSFTSNADYYQVGSSSKPASSITFTTTLAKEISIKSFSAKFGGFNGTAGTITLKVDGSIVSTGSLNASNDVVVTSSSMTSGKTLTVTVTNISKGVKCYNISFTYDDGSINVSAPTFNPAGGEFTVAQDVTITTETAGAAIYYTTDGRDPTNQCTQYTSALKITETTIVKAIAYVGDSYSDVAEATYTILDPAAPADFWQKVELADLRNYDDIFIIVGTNSDGSYALSNDNGTSAAPSAVPLTIEGNFITSKVEDKVKWTKVGTPSNGMVFYMYNDDSKWLYSTDTNNGVRVGTNTNNKFYLDDSGYLSLSTKGTTATNTRYLGIYNSQDWRAYTNTTGNTKDQTFSFFKRIQAGPITMNAYGIMTYASKYALDFSGVEGLTAHVATAYDSEKSKLTMAELQTAPAGTGLMLKGEANATYKVPVVEKADGLDTNLLVGLTEATLVYQTTGANTTFILAPDANDVPNWFKLAEDNYNLKANSAYLSLPTDALSDGTRLLAMDFGQTDGISTVKIADAGNAWYTLDGRRLQQPATKGVYINNGRKVVIK